MNLAGEVVAPSAGAPEKAIESRLRLIENYRAALAAALGGADETALEHAYEIGRVALDKGLGIVDVAHVHHEALLATLRRAGIDGPARAAVEAAGLFLIESLSPFEMSHRGFREANAALRRVNDMLDEEARRIARSLHDEASQLLVAVYIELESLSREAGPSLAPRAHRLRELLDGIGAQLRRLSHEIRPPILDDFGLVPALEFLAEGVRARAGLAVDVVGTTGGRVASSAELALYRVVQEALHNVVRHAQATRATIELRREPLRLACSVRDDGVGFEVSELLRAHGDRGLGLQGIRERIHALHGTLEIRSARGAGTELRVTVPLEG